MIMNVFMKFLLNYLITSNRQATSSECFEAREVYHQWIRTSQSPGKVGRRFHIRTRFRDFVVHLGGDMGAHHLEMLVHAVSEQLDLSSHLRGFVVFLRGTK